MTQSFFAFITAFFMIFSSLFGCGGDSTAACTPAKESEPETDGYAFAEKIEGTENSVFYIKRPSDEAYTTVDVSEFGIVPDAYDNYDDFCRAIEYCRANKHTRLVFENAEYYFRTPSPLPISGLTDTIIDGNGATFCFAQKEYFNISDCELIEIKNLSVKHCDENGRLASVVRIENADKNTHAFDMVFTELDEVSEDVPIAALTQYDADTLTPGVANNFKEHYIYSNPDSVISVKKVGANVLRLTHNGSLDNISTGDVFLLRHHVYGGNVFNVTSSSDITFSGINIYSAAGMGWLITDRTEHFQIINCTVGLETNGERISTTADAVHIANTNGHFRIADCDFSFMGDDTVNVHDNLALVTEKVSDKSAKLYSNAPNFKEGDTAVFFASDYGVTDFTAKVTKIDGDTVYFDTALPSYVTKGYIVVNGSIDSGNYVIINNRFHENRARALLLQSSYGLCTDNTFFKVMANPVKIISDISSGLWLEGKGANYVEVRNNTFEECNIVSWGPQIDISANIDGKTASRSLFSNITVADNTFSGNFDELISVKNASFVAIAGNTVKSPNAIISVGEHCSRISVTDNSVSDSPFGVKIRLKSISALFR